MPSGGNSVSKATGVRRANVCKKPIGSSGVWNRKGKAGSGGEMRLEGLAGARSASLCIQPSN